MSDYRNADLSVKRDSRDYWETFAEQYPEVFRQVERITHRAGTWDADAAVLRRAAGMLADYHDWAMRAKLAMFSRKAIAFDGLCRELEIMTVDMVKEVTT